MSRRKETQLTDRERILVTELRTLGLSLSAIASRLNIGTTLVWRILNGKENGKRKPRRRKLRHKP